MAAGKINFRPIEAFDFGIAQSRKRSNRQHWQYIGCTALCLPRILFLT